MLRGADGRRDGVFRSVAAGGDDGAFPSALDVGRRDPIGVATVVLGGATGL